MREILALIIEGLTVNQPKCKTRDASRASGGVKSDGTRHGGTGMVTKADGEEIVDIRKKADRIERQQPLASRVAL